MKASFHKHLLQFKKPSGTSRGVLTEKETWFIVISDGGRKGIGECGLLRGLSIDDRPDYESMLQWACSHIDQGKEVLMAALDEFPSIRFGIEMAFQSLSSHNPFLLFRSEFTNGSEAIDINGLVWMGSAQEMKKQISQKLDQGFHCIKLKIGAIDFDSELALIAAIRQLFPAEQIEIRVDANGAFIFEDALYKLSQLSGYNIHSIEQPIAKDQHDNMSALCKTSPIPVALDEELIGVTNTRERLALLEKIQPHYLILKPSLLGGFDSCKEWIGLAAQCNIGWWVTSALESNIGLNAIAQWTYTLGNPMPQGLGTGGLYTNNFESPLEVGAGQLWYRPDIEWQIPF